MAEKKNKKIRTVPEVIDALEQCGGLIGKSCEYLQISKNAFYKSYRHIPEVDAAIDRIQRDAFDEVTETIFNNAINGDPRFCQLFLKYSPVAKKRGWVEEKNIKLETKKPLTDEEKDQLKNNLFGKL